MRIKDETLVDPEDEEVVQDELTDELSSYFKCERIPKVLLTTSSKPKSYVSYHFGFYFFICQMSSIIMFGRCHPK